MSSYSLKAKLGALIYDVPRTLWSLRPQQLSSSQYPWLRIKNRNEHLISDPNNDPHSHGVKCDWQWTSDLYLPKVYPIFGRWLYRRAFRDFPIALKEQPGITENGKPDASFIIGHRGMERLPLLLITLKSIAGQSGCVIECIVVEQDNEPQIKNRLPDWIRYIHTPPPEKDMPYSRSWAFNVGAKEAQSEFLIFHDNDMLVPEFYAKELLKHFHTGYEVINLKRFIFYLGKSDSDRVCDQSSTNIESDPEAIVQNLEAGGSVGISRHACQEIGGFDERFIGWGGEDNEFWERAQTRKVFPYGHLPIVHLWHAPQIDKHKAEASGIGLHRELEKQSPEDRIRSLRAMQ